MQVPVQWKPVRRFRDPFETRCKMLQDWTWHDPALAVGASVGEKFASW